MHRSLTTAGLVIFALVSFPSSAVASDFSGLVIDALLIVGGISLACLAAGYVTTRLLVRRQHRGTTVGCTLLFAGVWFAIGWFAAEVCYW